MKGHPFLMRNVLPDNGFTTVNVRNSSGRPEQSRADGRGTVRLRGETEEDRRLSDSKERNKPCLSILGLFHIRGSRRDITGSAVLNVSHDNEKETLRTCNI